MNPRPKTQKEVLMENIRLGKRAQAQRNQNMEIEQDEDLLRIMRLTNENVKRNKRQKTIPDDQTIHVIDV